MLEDLDFREKGGYTRAIVEVHHSSTGVRACLHEGRTREEAAYIQIRTTNQSCVRTQTPSQEIVEALLYTGNTRNPNFQNIEHDVAAHVIAWSVGPSGHNIEYFLSGELLGDPVGERVIDNVLRLRLLFSLTQPLPLPFQCSSARVPDTRGGGVRRNLHAGGARARGKHTKSQTKPPSLVESTGE